MRMSLTLVMPGLVPGIYFPPRHSGARAEQANPKSIHQCGGWRNGFRVWSFGPYRNDGVIKSGRKGGKSIGLAPKPARQHLLENLAADRLVGERGRMPPPSVALHFLRGRDKAALHLGEIGVGEDQAEDEAAGADPAQREPFGAQVVLEHPVVAGRLGVLHGPDRGEVGYAKWKVLVREPCIERLGPAVPGRVQPVIDAAEVRARKPRQER